jgi:hypothetical protein
MNSTFIRVPEGAVRPYVAGDLLDFGQALGWTVPQFLDAAECSALIARIERAGCMPAPITTHTGFVMRPEIRNNDRAIIEDPDLSARLFERLRPHVPGVMCGGMIACGANERFRCYRYRPGQRFAPHYDGAFVRSPSEESLLTFMVYLNDDFVGGCTRFLDLEGGTIEPSAGMALLFQHALLHEGCAVESGVKYVLRSDVMYRRGQCRQTDG